MTAIECNGSNNIDVQEQATSLDRLGELGVYRWVRPWESTDCLWTDAGCFLLALYVQTNDTTKVTTIDAKLIFLYLI